MDQFSYIANADPTAIESLYQTYKSTPDALDITWKKFFEGFDFSISKYAVPSTGTNGHSAPSSPSNDVKEILVYRLIRGYRIRGHLKARTNPVRDRKYREARIDIKDYGLSEADLDTRFKISSEIGLQNGTLREVVQILRTIYEGSFGFEYMYIRQLDVQQWLQTEFEKAAQAYNPSVEIKTRILQKLNEAVVFENFLATKYVGQKRFGLEGGENAIVAIDTIINVGSIMGIEEVVIGMAHRGRLNVLCNIMGKTYEQIFNEFEGKINYDSIEGAGDVKYHMGYASETTSMYNKKVQLKLMPNPSHLEAVDPVVLGYTRAQIEDEYQGDFKRAVPIIIHGDAAVAGQGIVYETIQMANLEGYTTGGTIHFVINNQVGFTTDFEDARSGIYCTDVAKVTDAPVIHVNGDDAQAVAFAAKTAIEFRQLFARDIFIDMVCYRRNGHNESDEPRFTQPKLYSLIAKHPSVREVYREELIKRGEISKDQADQMDQEFKNLLQEKQNLVKETALPYVPSKIEQEWLQMTKATAKDFEVSPATGIDKKHVDLLTKALTHIPEGFKPLKQISNLLTERKKLIDEGKVNWALAELMAYGSILLENKMVRFTGQDVKRGTFSHRHAYFFDSESNEPYCQLDNIAPGKQQKLRIHNSLLSEFGVLGYEYGYAMASPNSLVIWEAQFGDFANGAQTIIDQFISSAETKWNRMNGLVMLLPHGFEGQGPEHSSARPERFLQLAAEFNMIVANVTTPANLFHIMRRQLAWNFRKPCIIMSPKSLLRHPLVQSNLDDLVKGRFKETIDDEAKLKPENVKRVLFCTGKVYFDLLQERDNQKIEDIAIVRIEQLYPFPHTQVDALVAKYKNADYFWVQEEPENMGYWEYILRIHRSFYWNGISRKPSCSPATGYAKIHAKEQSELVKKALTL